MAFQCREQQNQFFAFVRMEGRERRLQELAGILEGYNLGYTPLLAVTKSQLTQGKLLCLFMFRGPVL